MNSIEKEDKNSVHVNGWREPGHVSKSAAILSKSHQPGTGDTHIKFILFRFAKPN